MEKTTKTTKHGKQRIKERCGTPKSSADRMCRLAAERGTRRMQTKGSLRRWLDDTASKYAGEKEYIVYGDKTYIFSKEMVLITVLQLPSEIARRRKKMIVAAC